MLLDQHGRRHQNGDLVAAFDGFEGRTHGDLGFSKADIAADQTFHGAVRDHVFLGRLDCRQLVCGLFVGERGLELFLPDRVGFEGDSGLGSALGLDLQKLGCHVLHGALSGLFLTSPGLATNLGKLGPCLGTPDVSLDQIDVGRRYIELGPAVEFKRKMLDLLTLLADDLHPKIDADAMRQMDHKIPGPQIQKTIDGSGCMLATGSLEHRATEDLIDRQDKRSIGDFKAAAQKPHDQHDTPVLGGLATPENLLHPGLFAVVHADDHRAAIGP